MCLICMCVCMIYTSCVLCTCVYRKLLFRIYIYSYIERGRENELNIIPTYIHTPIDIIHNLFPSFVSFFVTCFSVLINVRKWKSEFCFSLNK